MKRRRWIDEAAYIDLMTLCQFLPGPTSSQIGFSLGVLRGNGLLGGLLAWLGFTLPSALLLLAAAYGSVFYAGVNAGHILHGLKLVAVAVVANAVWSMGRGLWGAKMSYLRSGIALSALPIMIVLGVALGQVVTIGCGALMGAFFCRDSSFSMTGDLRFPVTRKRGLVALSLFAVLFLLPPFADTNQAVALFEAFFHAGSLVFGGGHVVLPMLQTELVTPGWISNENFLAGYGLAQAIPGPLFTIAAYLGSVMTIGPHGVAGAVLALLGIFTPGLLLVYGALPFWDDLRAKEEAQAAMRGVTAAVVGILAIAFYNNVLVVSVHTLFDVLLALAGFLGLTFWKVPSWAVVLAVAVAGAFLASA